MIAWDFTGPMPGSASSCSLVAVLMLTAASAMPAKASSAAKSSAMRFMRSPFVIVENRRDYTARRAAT
jgi:hypothetical protein